MRLIDKIHQSFALEVASKNEAPEPSFSVVELPAVEQVVEQVKTTRQPTTESGTPDDGGEGQEVRATVFTRSPWPTLEAYDEARRLVAQLHGLCDTTPAIGHYASTWLDAFCRAYNAGSVSNVRKAYCAIVEKWVKVEAMVEMAGVRRLVPGVKIQDKPIGVAPRIGEVANGYGNEGSDRGDSDCSESESQAGTSLFDHL